MAAYVTRKTHNQKIKALKEIIRQKDNEIAQEKRHRNNAIEQTDRIEQKYLAQKTLIKNLLESANSAYHVLYSVKADETNVARTARVIGNAQGILHSITNSSYNAADVAADLSHVCHMPPLQVYEPMEQRITKDAFWDSKGS